MTDPVLHALLAAQSAALLFAAGTWWRAWHCLCAETLWDAAFWSAVVLAQSVLVLGLLVLRSHPSGKSGQERAGGGAVRSRSPKFVYRIRIN